LADFNVESDMGDDRELEVTATWPEAVPALGVEEGDPFPLDTATKVWFTGKRKKSDDDADAVFQKTFPGGGITATDNVGLVTLDKEDTEGLKVYGDEVTLECDMQVLTPTSKVWTVAKGQWTFLRDVTQANS
jgi:hypothetical protein